VPSDVKRLLVKQTHETMQQLDMRGIAEAQISPGYVGGKAQSIGSANLALQANYY